MRIVFVLSAGFLLASCGALVQNKRSSAGDDEEKGTVSQDLIDTVVMVEDQSLALTLGTLDFTAAIVGCSSGYTKETADYVNSSAPTSLPVIKGDGNCKLILKKIRKDGVDYDVSGHAQLAGQSYSTIVGGNTLTLSVGSQLPSPIVETPAPSVSFKVSVVTEGAAAAVDALTAKAGITVTADDPLYFELAAPAGTTKVGVDTKSGGGLIEDLYLACSKDVGADNKCGENLQTNLRVGIAKDPNVALALADCVKIATGAPLSTHKKGEAKAAPNGGLRVAPLVGPGPLFANGNNELVVAVTDTVRGSCRYFQLTIKAP